MTEFTPTFETVTQSFGTFSPEQPRVIRFSDERAAKGGLASAQIDNLLAHIMPHVTSREEPDRNEITREITATWGTVSALHIFARSQLNPKRVFGEPIDKTRERASRLHTARLVSETLRPGGIVPAAGIHEVLPEGTSRNGIIRQLKAVSSKLSVARQAPNLRAELYGESTELMRKYDLTESVLARLALSELQPAWAADRNKSSAFGVEKMANILRGSRTIAVHAHVIRGQLDSSS